MYCAHFQFQRLPFNNTPDPAFYYSTPDHEEALATLQFAAQHRKGFVLVTGEVGAGKTLIGRMFLRQIDPGTATAVIHHTHLNGKQLLAAICRELNLCVDAGAGNAELTQRLQDYLLEQYARDRSVVVLLDEAQNLPDESFEELRMLGNLEADDAKLLQVCILGQPELRARFRRDNLKQIEQRLFRRFHLPALNLEQTRGYINHRLIVAGAADPDLFTPEALRRIFAVSQGIPRVINQLCDNALLTAYGRESRIVDEGIIDLVVEQDASVSEEKPEKASVSEAQDRHASKTSLDHDARARQVEQRIEKIYGSAPTLTETLLAEPLIDTEESIRLSTLVEEEIDALHERIQALQDNPRVSQVDLETIGRKQDELRKIVGGASTRWLVAKERIEAYRNELHTAIDSLVARCDNTQDRLESITRQMPSNNELENLRQNRAEEIERLMREMTSQREEFRRLLQQTQNQWSGIHQRVDHLSTKIEQQNTDPAAAARNEQETRQTREQIERLAKRMSDHAEQIRALEQQAAERFAATRQAIASLEDRAPNADQWQRLRAEHLEAFTQVLTRLQEENERVREFQETITAQTQRVSEEHQDLIDQLAERITAQVAHIDEVRERLFQQLADLQNQMRTLDQRFAAREDVQAIREQTEDALRAQQADAEEIRRQILEHRQTVHALIDHLAEDCRSAQEQIDVLAGTKVGQEQLAELNARHETDVHTLVEQLNAHRREMEDRYEAVLARWNQTRAQMEQWSASLAEADAVEDLRSRQAKDAADLMEALHRQRQDLEAVVEGVAQRCADTIERVRQLPDQVASAEDLETIRAEHTRRIQELCGHLANDKADLEQAIRQVEDRRAETHAALCELADRAASSEDVEQLRDEQSKQLNQVLERIEQESSEHQNRVDHLNQRWEDLRHSVLNRLDRDNHAHRHQVDELTRRWANLTRNVRKLASITTPASTFQAAQRTLSESLQELGEQVVAVSNKQEQDLRTLIDKLQQTSGRLDELENRTSPAAVQIEMSPRVSVELGELIRTAEQQREQLGAALQQAGTITDHLQGTSHQVRESLDQWTEQAQTVHEQTDQLRSSARVAATVLKAMQECSRAVDAKIKSQRWQTELQRGEQLVGRLEQATAQAQTVCRQLQAALADFETCEKRADDWQQRRIQAQQIGHRLTTLLSKAETTSTHMEQSLNSRQRLLQAIAHNTASLADVIRTARDDTELQQDTRQPAHNAG